jgi:hypothetical protein
LYVYINPLFTWTHTFSVGPQDRSFTTCSIFIHHYIMQIHSHYSMVGIKVLDQEITIKCIKIMTSILAYTHNQILE